MKKPKRIILATVGWFSMLAGVVFGSGLYRFLDIADKSWMFGGAELDREMRAWIGFSLVGLVCLLFCYIPEE
ncbi:hypothetical protein LMIY3S_01133 [Labrys miyagiensis]